MENVEPFECCPSIGRHISYTHVVKHEQLRSKSAKPVDRVMDKLLRRMRPLQPYGETLFKVDPKSGPKRDLKKATVSETSVKPYTRWLDEFEPGDQLPLVPPGFQINLCQDMSAGRLVNRDRKKRERFAPMNEAEIATIGDFDFKTLGPKIKDQVYSLLSAVARSRGLWVDDKNKLRCPPGTPNANQFTDITGSNCWIPVPVKPAGIASSGARLARRTSQEALDALSGAMAPGARNYTGGYGSGGLVGRREMFSRGRGMMIQAETMRKDFRDGLFILPSGKRITHFKQNAEGKANFLATVQELLPNVDLAQAGEFFDGMLGDHLTTLQKAQLMEYNEHFLMSFFLEAKESPEKAKWLNSMRIAGPELGDAWQIQIKGLAGQQNKKGQTVFDPNMPISESGFAMSMTYNPQGAYYLAKGHGNDKRHTAHGSASTMSSQGAYTATHEFGHLSHFSEGMKNMGIDVNKLRKGKNGEWLVDLRNISNPNNDPRIARIQAMVKRVENFQSGQRYETLPSGQRVRRYAKDVKEAVGELYGELYSAIRENLGGDEEDFRLLANFVGGNYGHSNLIETRAEAWAVIRHHGPQGVTTFAAENAAYQAANPNLFPSPESEDEIADRVYSAMDKVFGTHTRDWYHQRNDAFGRNNATGGGAVTPIPAAQPYAPGAPVSGGRSQGLARFMPRSIVARRTPPPGGVSGPMSPRSVTGSARANTPNTNGVTGSLTAKKSEIYKARPKDSGLMQVSVDGRKAAAKVDANVADLLADAGIISGSVDISDVLPESGLILEIEGSMEKIGDAAGVIFVDGTENLIDGDDAYTIIRTTGKAHLASVERDAGRKKSRADRDRPQIEQRINQMKVAVEQEQNRVSEIRDLMEKLDKDKNNLELLKLESDLAYPEHTLSETLEKIEARRRIFEDQLSLSEQSLRDLDSETGKIDNDVIDDSKAKAEKSTLVAAAAFSKVNKKYPWLPKPLVRLSKPEIERNRKHPSTAGSSGPELIEGRIVQVMNLSIPASDIEKENLPGYGVAGPRSISDVHGSQKLSSTAVVFHESGHSIDHALHLRALGIKGGLDSKPVFEQIKDVGPELGDTAIGGLYAVATGRSPFTKLDDMSDLEKTAMSEFVARALILDATPSTDPKPGSRMREIALSAVEYLTPGGSRKGKTPKADVIVRSIDFEARNVGFPFADPAGGMGTSRIVKGKEQAATKILAELNDVIGGSLGYDLDEGALGNPDRILSRNGIGSEASMYAKTNRTERFAESFAVSMLMDEFNSDVPNEDVARPRQLATSVQNMINNAPNRDTPATLSQDQKNKIADLQSKLHEITEISSSRFDKDEWKLASALDLNSEIKETDELAYKFKPLSTKNIRFADNTTGSMDEQKRVATEFAGFATANGDSFDFSAEGMISKSGKNFDSVKFVDPSSVEAIQNAYEYGPAISEQNSIIGMRLDKTNFNEKAYKKLRKKGYSINDSFRLAGGRQERFAVDAQSEPEIGLVPILWNAKRTENTNISDIQIGSEITGTTSRIQDGNGVVGAMSDLPQNTYSGFKTSQGSTYKYTSSGRVVRMKPADHISSPLGAGDTTSTFENTVFVSKEDLDALKVSFDRGVGLTEDGRLAGLKYDATSLNREKFSELRRQGRTFDAAYTAAGGKIDRYAIEPKRTPQIGLHPFEWDASGRHHPGNAIVEVTERADGVSGAMSAADRRSGSLKATEDRLAKSEARAKNLEKAVQDLEKTGDWRGGDYGVVLADNQDKFADDIDSPDIKPKNRSAAEFRSQGKETVDVLEQAKEKLRRSKEETRLQKYLHDSKKKRHKQNVLDIEDIDDDTFSILAAEQADLVSLQQSDKDEFARRLSTGVNGESFVIHAGSSELDNGLLDPDRTQGAGGNPGGAGDTQALNAMQLRNAQDEVKTQEKIVERARELIEKLENRKPITIESKQDIQLLHNLERGLSGSRQSLGKMKIGDTINVSGLADVSYLGQMVDGVRGPDTTKTFDEVLDFVLNDKLNGINSQISAAEERANRLKPMIERMMESPRSGFLSSYPLAGVPDSRGYFGRYADGVIPSDSSGWMKTRWNSFLRGTQWLVKGKEGRDVTSYFGPGDERQILGVNKPLFGLSARRSDHSKLDQVSLAIMARAAKLIQQGMDVTPEAVLEMG